ncbi:MAG: histidine kinase, partial [Alphaproteobacteria bacterium]|nr:histidine kinase [Alphaproteobacteria bacterium]
REEAMGRGKRLDESAPGSGLGLAIVADIAALYGGELKLEKSPMGGLRTVLLLPSAAG